MPKLISFLIPFTLLLVAAAVSCTTRNIVRENIIPKQRLISTVNQDNVGLTTISEEKQPATGISIRNKHAVKKATGDGKKIETQKGVKTTGNGSASVEPSIVEVPKELRASDNEDDKEHISNLPTRPKDARPVKPFGRAVRQTHLPSARLEKPFGRVVGQADKKELDQIGLAQLELGNVYMEKGLVDEAILMFKNAIDLNPHHLESHVRLGTAYGLKGMNSEALSEFKKAIDVDLNEAVAKIVFNVLPTDKNSKVKIDEAEAHIKLANAYREGQKLEEAKLEYEKVLEIKPDHQIAKKSLSKIYYELGTLYLQEKKYDNAIAVLSKALEIEPDFPQIKDVLEAAHYNLGLNYARNKELDKAILEFNTAIDINPDYAKLDKNILKIINKKVPAVPHRSYREINENPPKSPFEKGGEIPLKSPFEKGGKRGIIKNDDEEKVSILNSTIDNVGINNNKISETVSDSGHTIISYYINRDYKPDLGFNEAIEKYEDVIRKNPYDNNAHHNLAYAYYSKAMYLDDAVARREEDILERNQGFIVKRFFLHNASDDEEIDETSLIKQSETLERDSLSLYNKLGNVYVKKGMYEKAILEYKNALELNPNYSKALYNLAFSFFKKGSYLDIALKGKSPSKKSSFKLEKIISLSK